jgi:hypothetical protein
VGEAKGSRTHQLTESGAHRRTAVMNRDFCWLKTCWSVPTACWPTALWGPLAQAQLVRITGLGRAHTRTVNTPPQLEEAGAGVFEDLRVRVVAVV